ncbi:uncharacterized protein LOC123688816 [Harmonia axyridis]|uniref:uncharacterized protein LOC123688816 n=1 Tax=Harmonia axyridis TaxID=115357 RepID=UPI001E2771B7|nr:uncharacterized protein LOC123688816 [Harmonia axyridis]
MKTNFVIILFGVWSAFIFKTLATNRVKRLVWPPGGDKIQMIAGVGIPVDLQRETVIFGMVYKAAYALPNNVTQLQSSNTIYQRHARSSELENKNIVNYLERFLYVQNQYSKKCVLRTICEAASSNFDQNGGFINEVINIIFGSMEETIRHHDDTSYMDAFKQGVADPDSCIKIYPQCKSNLLDVISDQEENSV